MNTSDKEEMKQFLDEIIKKINVKDFIKDDPVQFPHRFSKKRDIEIIGFIISLISWGKRTMILRDAEKILSIMGDSPYQYIMEGSFPEPSSVAVHRTMNMEDFIFICRGLNYVYSKHESMEEIFTGRDMFDGIEILRKMIIEANGLPGHRAERQISAPSKGSACKRIHMFLKWMVRNDGIVDLGIWKSISPSSLYIPLDIHVINISKHLGILKRKQNDRKSVEELTSYLKDLRPDDPVIYDYALFGLGVTGYLKDKQNI